MVLYGAFVSVLGGCIGYVGWLWCRRVGAVATSWAYHSVLEMLWTVVPVVFLTLGLVQGMATLWVVSGFTAGDLSGVVAVVGHQW